MIAIHSASDVSASPTRAHVFDLHHPRATHAFEPTYALADGPTLRYTLAGSPSGNLRGNRGTPCA
jgi:hypothetical protein